MKNYRIIIYYLLITLLMVSCQENENDSLQQSDRELTFYPSIKQMETQSRAVNNDFFEEKDEVEIKVTQRRADGVINNMTFIYQYGSDGVFRGNPTGYHFPIDDSYITELEVVWPTEQWKQQNTDQILTDQRELSNYRKSDWLEAVTTITGLMPAEAPVPLTFEHQHCVLEFQLVGQTINDLTIRSLVIELIVNGEKTAYWAYCNNENGHAELILKAGTEINVSDGYLFGRAEIADKNNNPVNCTIIMPATNIELKGGHKYLITLSSQGYDVTGILSLRGWYTESGSTGIGIPLTPPELDKNGNYLIHTPAELIGVSYLIRHYNDDTTIQWHEQTYVFSDSFEFTEEYLSHWVAIPEQDFSGKFVWNGIEVKTITYTVGGETLTLNLFE